MSGSFLYFAYGSNMLTQRLLERCPSAKIVGQAKLPGHRLAWHKRGRDGSGKCDAFQTGGHDLLHGVLYTIHQSEEAALDRAEGRGRGYRHNVVTVFGPDGAAAGAKTYHALELDAALRPFVWYKAYVLFGAREHGLPEDYVAAIEATRAARDPSPLRRARELARVRRFGLADTGAALQTSEWEN